MEVKMYRLIDTTAIGINQIRYVGKTCQSFTKRLKDHINESKKDAYTHKHRWINKMLRVGVKPEIELIEVVDSSIWRERETFWVAHYRALGAPLTNSTSGGEGLHNPSAETRKKMSNNAKVAMKNPLIRAKIFTPARSVKISAALSGKKKSKEHIAKLPQNQKGHSHHISDAGRIKMSMGSKRSNEMRPPGTRGSHSDETKQKIAEKLKGNTHTKGRILSDEEKLQRSVALKGRPKSTEWKKKAKEAALRRWARVRESKLT